MEKTIAKLMEDYNVAGMSVALIKNGELVSEALKRTGFNNGRFKKGVRNCPEWEFKKGHVESPESKAKRSAALKASWRKRKRREELKYYGIGITI